MQRGQHEAKTVILVGNPQKSALQTLANMNLHYLPNQSSQTEGVFYMTITFFNYKESLLI